ncbi:MAG: hypothetical protein A2W29_00655 [Gemmatimonadetes bacterium RBG_16_66_8]|nr:MAG: hypothetical protein A2W29_00655 [Gemmatimonadetes bacterium RBG_16_66_8]
MGKGQEYLKRVGAALEVYERAVVRREHAKPLIDSKVSLQQEVDRARDDLMNVIAKVVAEERLRGKG